MDAVIITLLGDCFVTLRFGVVGIGGTGGTSSCDILSLILIGVCFFFLGAGVAFRGVALGLESGFDLSVDGSGG